MTENSAIRVLLVDDDEVDRMAIVRALSADEGFVVGECSDADTALAKIEGADYDVVLCDLSMPGHDGAWLLAQVGGRGLGVPVVMLTGQGDELTAVRLMKAGAQDYLIKDGRSLLRIGGVLRNAVHLQQAERRTRAALAALENSERRLRLALEAAELGSYEVDLHTGALQIDDRCRALFGIRSERDVTRELLFGAIHPEDQAVVLRLERDTLDAGESRTSTAQYRIIGIDDGIERWLHAVGRVFTDDEGRPLRTVGTIADVTARRRREELDRHRAEFEQQLIGIVSHDLRNPISAMVMGASLLTHRLPPDSADGRVAHRIVASGERASRLIHDLLDFTRARSSAGIPLMRSEIDIHDTCRQAIDEIAMNWPTRTIQHERAGEAIGRWDPDRIIQVVTNLVTNALVYGDTSAAVTLRSSGDSKRVRIEVHNFGRPIPAHGIDRLFEPFTRDVAGHDSGRGIGLGLFIVREIVRAHGGTVRVDSTERDGTTFCVELPRLV